MNVLQVSLFGKAQIYRNSQIVLNLSQKAQELLFYLVLYQDRPHFREELACKLWRDASTKQSKKYLRQTLWQVQTILDDPEESLAEKLLTIDSGWIQINPRYPLQVDASSFVRAFKQSQDTLGQNLTSGQVDILNQSIESYKGELLTGWYQDWCILERERLQAFYLATLDKLTDYAIANHQYVRGIEYCMSMLRSDYAREKTHRRLMQLYYLSGDRTQALRQYERCIQILKDELDAQPTKQTERLHEEILVDQVGEWEQPARLQANAIPEWYKGFAQLITKLERIGDDLLCLQQEISSIKQSLEH